MMWVTADVHIAVYSSSSWYTSLYTVIPHDFAILALDWFLGIYSRYSVNLPENFSFYPWIIYWNTIVFLLIISIIYRSLELLFANIFISWWKKHIPFQYVQYNISSVFWFSRYIDNLLLIIQIYETLLPRFTEYLSNNCMGLSFTVTASTTSVSFLDLNLSIGKDSKVTTCKVTRKSNAGNTILHAFSHHPRHTIENIPVWEMLRARRNCS